MTSPINWKPLDIDNIRNPYRMYAHLRQTDPVFLSQTREYIITKYEDIRYVLKSDSFESGNRLTWLKRGVEYFSNKEEDLRSIYKAMNSFVLMLNDEQHLKIRNFVTRSWDNREVDDIIHGNVAMLLNQITEAEFDFVSAFAQPLPVHTIAAILGVPVAECQHLINLGVAMTKTLDLYISLKDLVLINGAARDFIAFFREQIRIKTEHPDEGLLSKMIRRNRMEDAGLSEEELISVAIFLFTAGEETSAGLISNTMFHLLKHPRQFDLLRRDRGLTESAIEEVLRYDSIVQLLGRVSKEEVTMRGKVIPARSTLTLVIASANRDEEVFSDPDEFLITRKPNRHLSFGSGVHYCLGDWLGRRQSKIAIDSFIQRYPTVSLPDQEFTWHKNLAVRRLDRLRVRVGR